MRRMCGFSAFWIAVGLVIALFIESIVIHVMLVIILILLGYNLFCC